MFTNNKAKYYGDNKVLIDAACLKTDSKPTTGIANGSKCIEMDTGKTYMFNEEDSEWEELPSSGGGGGSSDFSTAEVTLNLTPPHELTFVNEDITSAISYPSTAFDFNGDGYYYTNPAFRATNHKVSVLLYNGVGYIDSVSGVTSEEDTFWAVLSSATLSGDIVWDANIGDFGAFVVTGNGTITISEWAD